MKSRSRSSTFSTDEDQDRSVQLNDSVDEGSFVKVFTSTGINIIIPNLTNESRALFLDLIIRLNIGNDVISLSNQEVMSYLQVGINKARDTVNQLLKEQVIARVSNSKKSKDFYSYYINPRYFFKGRRHTYYKAVHILKEQSRALLD